MNYEDFEKKTKRKSKAREEKSGCATVLGKVALTLIGGFGLLFLNAWALKMLWGWFAVSAFGLPTVPYVVFIGLLYIVGIVGIHIYPMDKIKEESEKLKKQEEEQKEESNLENFLLYLGKAVVTLITLGGAWVIYLLLL